jgi:hypothetical protein
MDEKEKRKGKRNGGGLGIYRLENFAEFPDWEGSMEAGNRLLRSGNVTTPRGS